MQKRFSVKDPFLYLVMGCMKAEKSTEGVRMVRKFSRYVPCVIVNSAVDTRHDNDIIQTHSGDQMQCIKVLKLEELEARKDFQEAQLVVLDEAQFFPDLVSHVLKFCLEKSYVVCSLDSDYKQQKFGQVWKLIPYADRIVKKTALCELCADGTEAVCTIRTEPPSTHIHNKISIDSVGGSKYMSVCRKHAIENQ